MDQRKLMDNANTITDMAKVGISFFILLYPIKFFGQGMHSRFKQELYIQSENRMNQDFFKS